MDARRPTRHRSQHRKPPPIRFAGLIAALFVALVGVLGWRTNGFGLFDPGTSSSAVGAAKDGGSADGASGASTTPGGRSPATAPSSVPTTPGPINSSFPGLTTFRGNATRDYYGEGPVPHHPVIRWRYPPTGGLCSSSSDIHGSRVWCGTGWTGQPNVIPRRDGTIEVREGAYDAHYHFLNGLTGEPVRPDLVTGDLAKGSATSDASGYPLYYAGSRDNYLRVVALDRSRPTVLWSFNSRSQPGRVWNDDWDGAPLQIGDYLLEGGENSWFYVIRLHRRYDAGHHVQVSPQIVMRVPGWDQQLLHDLGDEDISIEDSVAFRDGVVYFGNSGGLVQGWDISDVLRGGTHYRRVFRYWVGDDVDASIAIDAQGYLYVGRHVESNVPRSTARDHQIGALAKLDPAHPRQPLVWSVPVGNYAPENGILGTPALYKGIVYATDTSGGLLAVDQESGKLLWQIDLPVASWGSPVPIDDELLIGDCAGALHDFDISNPRRPPKELWRIDLGGCVESTPAVWHGWIYVGSRNGGIYGIADPKAG